jgi:transcriptional regulator with XRE-family HTH domain
MCAIAQHTCQNADKITILQMRNQNSFGEWLRTERTERGLSQDAVAALGDIGVTTVSQFETGRRQPTERFVLRVAKAFELTPDETFEQLANAGLWDGPVKVEKGGDAWWIGECKRAARNASRSAIELGVVMFKAAITAETKNESK